MAGHTRTVDTGTARRTRTGKVRRIRQHLPAGQSEKARRDKAHRGARTVALARIDRARTPLDKLEAARQYVRSAAAKYGIADPDVAAAVTALLAAGDRIFQTRQPLSAAARARRRSAREAQRVRRTHTRTLLRLGKQAARQARTAAGSRR